MNFKRTFSVALIGAGLSVTTALMTIAPGSAQEKGTFDAKQTKEIEGIVKSYLLKNPEVVQKAIAALNKRHETAALERRRDALSSLYKEETPFSIGKGKVTMVEFFDYNCGYCRRAFNKLLELTKKEKDFRIVFVEFPILSDESKLASKAAIAAAKQNKYFDFHSALMTSPGAITEEKIYKSAANVGLDVEKLKADMKTPEVEKTLNKNMHLATAMGIQGTPAFFIGDEAIPGAPDNLIEMLRTSIAKVRENGCKAC